MNTQKMAVAVVVGGGERRMTLCRNKDEQLKTEAADFCERTFLRFHVGSQELMKMMRTHTLFFLFVLKSTSSFDQLFDNLPNIWRVCCAWVITSLPPPSSSSSSPLPPLPPVQVMPMIKEVSALSAQSELDRTRIQRSATHTQ